MLTKRVLLETAALAMVAAAGTIPRPLLAQERVAQTDAGPSPEEIRTRDAQSEEEWYYSVGIQNYVFTLPLTMLERERKVRLNPVALEKAKKFAPAAPVNQIGHMKTLATADDVMPYTPNNDTVYSGALLELADEPIILTAPDILDRYWSIEVADVYTNNLFYIGTRATDGKGGNHAFVGPKWKGRLPTGVIEHRVPSNTIMFAIRIGVVPQDNEDLLKVNALQEKFYLTSLSNWGDKSKFGKAPVRPLAKRPDYQGDLAYFQTVADLLTENPPPKDQDAAVILLSRGGINVGQPMDTSKLDDAAHKGLARAAEMGPQIMKWKVKFRGTPYPTRWNNLRPGTYGYDYFDRAAGALEGLFVHDRAEAEYFSTYEDGNANLLDGVNRYVVHFNKDEIPPTLKHGFWSFTMYGSDFQLVKNPINRFSIGDRTKGLTYTPNGSLDIYIQSQAPSGHEGNWLPCSERIIPHQLQDLPADERGSGSGDVGQVSSAYQKSQLIIGAVAQRVRSGSLAATQPAKRRVRFTPNNGREGGCPSYCGVVSRLMEKTMPLPTTWFSYPHAERAFRDRPHRSNDE